MDIFVIFENNYLGVIFKRISFYVFKLLLKQTYMRGTNITNIYVIDSKEYFIQDLNETLKIYVESLANKTLYNNLRNELLETRGDDFTCSIKINFPKQDMEVFDANNRQIAYAYTS